MSNQTQFSGFPQVSAQGLWDTSTTALHNIGSYIETADGRGFRYCKVGGVDTVAGKVYQSSALDATNLQPSGGLGVAAQAIGDTTVTISTSITLTGAAVGGSNS